MGAVTTEPVRISRRTHRRYVLGRQGLWPGRRWSGESGVRRAVLECQAIQVDPLNVIARSHELALAARVDDFRPEQLEQLLYGRRELFDYGGVVFIWRMEDLPYLRVAMRRRAKEPRWAAFAADHRPLLRTVRAELRKRGPLGARDLPEGGSGPGNGFRSARDAGKALYYLWLTGELMTHGRRGFDRIYNFVDEVAPKEHAGTATAPEADAFFALKAMDFMGLCSARTWREWTSGFSRRRLTKDEAARKLSRLCSTGEVMPVQVEDWPEPFYTTTANVQLLEAVEGGGVPRPWRPVGDTTDREATLLAPLDIVSARGRAALLFDFDYVWEVYKPASVRRYGYYTMPVLHGDTLVGRLDPRLDRERSTVVLNGIWLDDPRAAQDPELVGALGRALRRLATLVGARAVDVSSVAPVALRRQLPEAIGLENGRGR